MSFRDTQNPGIGGLDEITDAETLLLQNFASLGDPGADRILFWDESANAFAYLTAGAGLTITGTTIEASAGSLDGSGTTNEIAYWVDSNTLGALAVATYPSLTELTYLKGVTSGIQGQLNAKAASLGADDNYVTDAQLIVIQNTSGTNTGDNATNSQYSGLASSKADVAQTFYIGTTQVAINRSSASLSLTGTITDGNLALTGGTMSGNITLGENASLDFDPAGSADGKYTGIAVTATAGEALAFGDVIVLDVTAGKWFKGSVSAAAGADGDLRGGTGMCVLAAAGADSATKVLLMGTCRADANFPALTIGSVVYASTTGDITVTQPSTTDHIIKVLGYALTADEIMFCPSMDYITHI